MTVQLRGMLRCGRCHFVICEACDADVADDLARVHLKGNAGHGDLIDVARAKQGFDRAADARVFLVDAKDLLQPLDVDDRQFA